MKTIYNFLLACVLTAGMPVLLPYLVFSRKRRQTVLQRLGFQNFSSFINSKPVIWVHALSVGEVLSAVPLVHALAKRLPEKSIRFSASTLTGFQTARERLSQIADELFYFPYDLPLSVRRTINLVQPEILIIVETDLWPNFLEEIGKRHIPAFLVNARLSDSSFKGYRRFHRLFTPALRTFTKICVQSESDKKRFQGLGIDSGQIFTAGNIKFDQSVPLISEKKRDQIRSRFGILKDQPLIVAGSTHEGEERVLRQAFETLKKQLSDLRLIVVPRNPERAAKICSLFRERFTAQTLSDIEQKNTSPDIAAVDRIGMLQSLYAAADAAFVGGSLVPCGGHNPLEPAGYGIPIAFGPHMEDFREISKQLLESGGAVQVDDAASLADIFLQWLKHPDEAEKAGQKGLALVEAGRGAVNRIVGTIL